MKLDILAFAAHPDDAELSCSGSLLKHIAMGKKAGIVDLTRGELGTRGTPQLRQKEAAKAGRILGVQVRENMGFKDCFFQNDAAHRLALIEKIRQYRPDVVLANAPADRHPDHARAAALVSEACYYSGLVKIETGKNQKPWRPAAVYHYIQDDYIKPDFLVDISAFMDAKIKSIEAYSSQFYNPASKEPETPISSENFFEFVRARHSVFGRMIGVRYAEGFVSARGIGVHSFFDIV